MFTIFKKKRFKKKMEKICPLGMQVCHCRQTKGLSGGGGKYIKKDTHGIMRKVWDDHAWWTVQFINAAIFNLSYATAAQNRLMKNQEEIGKEFVKHFPRVVSLINGDHMTSLLKTHIGLAAGVVTIAIKSVKKKVTDDEKVLDAVQELYKQGDNMSAFFAKLLELPYESVKKEFRTHNEHVVELATLLILNEAENYRIELDAYINHMLTVADLFHAQASELNKQR
jgi:hypothetical protein